MKFDPFRRLAEVTDLLVDPKVGVVSYLCEQPREPGTAEFFHFAGQACKTDAFSQFRNFRSTGGAATSRAMAMARSIGEAVERYSCAIVDLPSFPVHSAEDAPFDCTDPTLYELYGKSQYGAPNFQFVPFRPDTSVRWCPALRARDGAEVWVPAAMVYVPYVFYQGHGDHAIFQPNSTGLSSHMSYAEAAIGGICEVVERDCFSIAWQAMLRPPKIARDSLGPEQLRRLEKFEKMGSKVELLDLTTDLGVPAVMAVQRNTQPGAPPVAFSASVEPDPYSATSKALDELAHTLRYMLHIKRRMAPLPELEGHANVLDQETHLNYWCSQERAKYAEFLFESPIVRGLDELPDLRRNDPRAQMQALVEAIGKAGYETYLCDVTTDDVRPLGFRIVKAIIPGLHPLFWNHRYRSLGGTRLATVPEYLGQAPIRAEADNPQPHPYP